MPKETAIARLEVSLFGLFQVILDGQPIKTFESNKVRALLAFLCAESSRPLRREAIAELIWPGWPQKSAMRNLSYALADLRKNLADRETNPPFLVIDRQILQLNPEGDRRIDLEDFDQLLRQNTLDRQRTAIDLFKGEFLEGFSLDDSPAFEAWILEKREYYRRRVMDVFTNLVDDHLDRGEIELALDLARHQLVIDPLSQSAHQRIMKILATSGQRCAALAQYQVYQELLKKELGIEADDETARLYKQIRAGEYSLPEEIPEFLKLAELPELESPLFVARQAERQKLRDALRKAMSGHGQVVMIAGGPGQGKTALVREFSRQAQVEYKDLAVVTGSCQAYFGVGDPYLPFREVLAMLTGQVEELWLAGTISQEHARQLWSLAKYAIVAVVEKGRALVETFISGTPLLERARQITGIKVPILDQLREVVRFRHADRSLDQANQEALFSQYIEVVRSTSKHAPLLIFLDDLQWADTASLSLLFALGRKIAGCRLLLIGAYRPEELLPDKNGNAHPLETICSEFGLIYENLVINLDEVQEQILVDELLDNQSNRLDRAFRETLFQQTRGHPLFTIELLREMQASGEIIQNQDGEWVQAASFDLERLPSKVNAAISKRIQRLPESLRSLLQTASVEGEWFTAEVLMAINAVEWRQLIKLLGEELDRQHHLIRADSVIHVGVQRLSRYRFRHILYQRYLFSTIDRVQRVYINEQVALMLERLYGEHVDEISLKLARHYERAGLPEKTVEFLVKAAKRAEKLSAFKEALENYNRALALTNETDINTRFAILLSRVKVFYITGPRQAEEADIRELEKLASLLGEAQQAEVALCRARMKIQTWKWEDLHESVGKVLTWARASGQLEMEAEATYLGAFGRYEKDVAEWLERALLLARQVGLRKLEANILTDLARAYCETGEFSKARDYSKEAVQIFRASADRLGEGRAINVIGVSFNRQGDFFQALPFHEQSRLINREVANQFEEMVSFLAYEAEAYTYLGCLQEISDLLMEAIEITKNLKSLYLNGIPEFYLSIIYWLKGDQTSALAFAHKALEFLTNDQTLVFWKISGVITYEFHCLLGVILADAGQSEQARHYFSHLTQILREVNSSKYWFHPPMAGLARLALSDGDFTLALSLVEEYLPFIPDHLLEGVRFAAFWCCYFTDLWSFLTAYQVLLAVGDARAREIIIQAYHLLQERAGLINDENLLRSFLENIPWNREILMTWEQIHDGE